MDNTPSFKKRKSGGTAGKTKEQHNTIAKNFMCMVQVLDEFGKVYTRDSALASYNSKGGTKQLPVPDETKTEPYLHTVLQAWINMYSNTPTPTKRNLNPGYVHSLSKCPDDGRQDLPKWLKRDLHAFGQKNKAALEWRPSFFESDGSKDCRVTLWWIVAYLHQVTPDQNLLGWETVECSHRCIEKCLTATCLCWETKSTNQSRNNPACLKLCHCGCNASVCAANSVHVKHCL